MGLAFKPCFVVANCVGNVQNALYTRHLAPFLHPIPALPNPPYLYSSEAKSQLRERFAITCDAWMRRKTLRQRELILQSIAVDNPQPHFVKSHIKTEICLKMPTKARLIQASRTQRDSYEFADLYRAFTEALVEWSTIPRMYFGTKVHLRSACGLNRDQISEQVSDWVATYGMAFTIFIDDVKNMDGNVQGPHLQEQYSLYDELDPCLAAHARAAQEFWGVVYLKESTVRYKGKDTVKSGAQDTSSGQTARRLDCFIRCLYGSGVTLVAGFVFGDDLWVMMQGVLPTVEQMAVLQQACGWATKGVYVKSIEQSDFLASSFVPRASGGYAMRPLLGRMLAKLFWTWRTIPKARQGSYVHQVAEAFLPLFSGFDFMTMWLMWHMQVTVKKPFHWKEGWFLPQAADCIWDEFVARRYGLEMPDRLQLPDHHNVVALIYHPWAESVMRYDLADPQERTTF